MTQNNVGGAYHRLPTGDRGENLGKAIAAYELALTVRTRDADPDAWAATQHNLGLAYNRLPTGDRSENIGKAIAAYERLLLPGESRFDRYVEHIVDGGDQLEQEFLSDEEIRGLRLFIGDARCTECHNGPLFTNNEFHNTGLL